MRPQGRKLGLFLEWQPRRADLGADFNPEWYSGTSVGTPDPRTPHSHVASHEAVKRIPRPEQRPQKAAPQRPAAPSAAPTQRSHQEHAQRGHRALSSVTRAASRGISSADPAASRAAQCHPRGHQVPTERYQQRPSATPPTGSTGASTWSSLAPADSTHSALSSVQRPSIGERQPAAPTTAPDTWSPATQRASPGARNERPRALSSVQRPSGGVFCTISSTHRAPPAAPTAAPIAAPISSAQPRPQQRQTRRIRGHPPRYERHQERPTISTAAHQPHSPSANGSASRNHIGQPVPHVSSICRAPSAQSRH
ncbi:translation initiation factor IF-2-like [Drosophila subpulchrella]|uniref:translation initiation factor IF-2-like n=1 Tax=Drosophila subpulchrella TaxID=1486046 RepID=UPI0018A14FD7|nr:translation initiation factor IF-2-like [Drosophila subpulchrella]